MLSQPSSSNNGWDGESGGASKIIRAAYFSFLFVKSFTKKYKIGVASVM